jgi:CheY-like chemotaxis protein
MNDSVRDNAPVTIGNGSTIAPFPILIVDDEPILRELLCDTLIGCQVTTADDGSAAIRLLQQDRYDMVITDLMMPQVDGFAVLSAAKKADPATSVIVMTGYPSEENLARCRAMGCDDVLTKPFTVLAVRAAVDRCARRRREP